MCSCGSGNLADTQCTIIEYLCSKYSRPLFTGLTCSRRTLGKWLIYLVRVTIDRRSTAFEFLFTLIGSAGVLLMRLLHPKHQGVLTTNHITINAVSTTTFICLCNCESQNQGPTCICNMREFQQHVFEAFILEF